MTNSGKSFLLQTGKLTVHVHTNKFMITHRLTHEHIRRHMHARTDILDLNRFHVNIGDSMRAFTFCIKGWGPFVVSTSGFHKLKLLLFICN